MNTNDILEELKTFTIDHGLPKTDMSFFDTQCPYCGKNDRIQPLEHPDALSCTITPKDQSAYVRFWEHFTALGDGTLGVCKFCQNPLRLNSSGQAEPLYQR